MLKRLVSKHFSNALIDDGESFEVIRESADAIEPDSSTKLIKYEKRSSLEYFDSPLAEFQQSQTSIIIQEYEEKAKSLNIDIHDEAEQEALIEVLQKPKKTFADLLYLEKITALIPYFKNQEIAIKKQKEMLELLREFQLKTFAAGDFVFEEGDIGRYYCFVVEGSCTLFLPKSSKEIEEQKENNKPVNETHIVEEASVKNLNPDTPSKTDPQIEENPTPKILDFMNDEWLEVTFPHLKKLKNIGVGDGFGEISLLTNTTRTATVICNEVTQMLAINKSTFVNLSKMFVIDDLDKKLTFFKSFSLLNGLPPNELLSLMYATEKKIYKINEKIYDYGEPAKQVYLIVQGTVEVQKIFFDHIDESAITRDEKTTLLNTPRCRKSKKRVENWMILKELSYFGEWEILDEKEATEAKRNSVAICRSAECEIISVEKSLLFYYIEKHTHLLETLIAQTKQRETYTQEIIERNLRRKDQESTQQLKNGKGKLNLKIFLAENLETKVSILPEIKEREDLLQVPSRNEKSMVLSLPVTLHLPPASPSGREKNKRIISASSLSYTSEIYSPRSTSLDNSEEEEDLQLSSMKRSVSIKDLEKELAEKKEEEEEDRSDLPTLRERVEEVVHRLNNIEEFERKGLNLHSKNNSEIFGKKAQKERFAFIESYMERINVSHGDFVSYRLKKKLQLPKLVFPCSSLEVERMIEKQKEEETNIEDMQSDALQLDKVIDNLFGNNEKLHNYLIKKEKKTHVRSLSPLSLQEKKDNQIEKIEYAKKIELTDKISQRKNLALQLLHELRNFNEKEPEKRTVNEQTPFKALHVRKLSIRRNKSFEPQRDLSLFENDISIVERGKVVE